MVEFGILGPLRLAAGGTDTDVGGGRQRRLLGRLLVDANHVVARDRLVDDLLPGPGDAAATTLRTYVSRLRRLVGRDRILTVPPGYVLVAEREEVDADRFERLVARAREPGRPPPEVVALLDDAERLWRGPALAEFADLDWARPVAERLDRRRLDVAADRLDALLAGGRAGEVAGDAEALVDLHPLDERLWGLVVVAHYRSGRPADALRAYQRARSILRDELGIEPGPALRALEGAVLRHDPALVPAVVPLVLGGAGDGGGGGGAPAREVPEVRSDLSWIPPATGPLVGRGAALATITARVEKAGTGDGGLVLVGGEAGAGKTRLLAAAAGWADSDGCLVLYGRCEEDGLVPFQAVVPALAPALRQAITAGLVDLGSLAADLGVLFPDLDCTHAASPAGAPPLDADTRRHRLFEAIDRCFEQLARDRTVVLIVDDLHLADRAVLRLLHRIAGASPARRLAVVAALRSNEVDDGSPVLATVLDLRHRLTVDDVDLPALRPDEVADLLVSWLGDGIRGHEATEAQRIHRDTGGNPLFVTELIRDLRDRDADGAAAGPADDGRALPASVADVIASRVGRMDPTTQRFLHAASVVGLRFDADLVAAVAGLDDHVALDAIDEALARGILVELAPAGAGLGFSHAIVRRALYERLTTRRRAWLHLVVARTLEDRAGPELAEVAGDVVDALAHHHAAAARVGVGNRSDARRYARLAGDRAVAKLSYETGIVHYRRALDLAGVVPASDLAGAEERAELLLLLGQALNQGGDTEEAKAHLVEAVAVATALDRDDLAAEAALAYGGPLPAGVGLPDPRGLALLHDGIARERPPATDPGRQARLLARLAEAEYLTASRDRRQAWCDEAVTVARRLGDPRTLATVLVNQFWALYGPVDAEASLAAAVEAERIADRLGDAELSLRAVKCQLHSLVTLDAWPEAVRVAGRQRRRARELRQPDHERLALSFSAVLAGNDGRFADAEDLARRAHEVLERRGQGRHAELVLLIQQVPWLWLRSRSPELLDPLDALLERGHDDPSWDALIHRQRPTWQVAQGWLHAETGRPNLAADQLRAADLPSFVARDPDAEYWSTMAIAVWAAERLGDRDLAGLLYERLLPHRDRNAWVGQVAFFGCVEHLLGTAATVLDRPEAADHLRRAHTRYRRMDAPAYATRVADTLARLPAARHNGQQ